MLSRQAGARPDQGELEHLPHRRVHHRCRHHRHLHEDRVLRQVLLTMLSHFLWSEFTNKSEQHSYFLVKYLFMEKLPMNLSNLILYNLIEFLFKMDVLMKYAAKFFNIKYPTPPNSGWQSIFNLSLIPAVTISSPLRPFSHFKVNKSLSFQSLQPRGFSVSVPQFKGRPNSQKPFQLVTYNKFQNKIDIMKVKTPSRHSALP